MRDSTEIEIGVSYATGGNEIYRQLDKFVKREKLEEFEMKWQYLTKEEMEPVFFEQQVTGELLLAARTNVIDEIAYMTLLKFFEERGLTDEDLRCRRVTIRYSVEPV